MGTIPSHRSPSHVEKSMNYIYPPHFTSRLASPQNTARMDVTTEEDPRASHMVRPEASPQEWFPRHFYTRQTWTRCRIPVDKQIPSCLDLSSNEWSIKLAFLKRCAGYKYSLCGRNTADPECVIFIMSMLQNVVYQLL